MPNFKLIPGCLNFIQCERVLRLFTCVLGCHSNHPELIQYGKLSENFSRELVHFPEVSGISCFCLDSKYHINQAFSVQGGSWLNPWRHILIQMNTLTYHNLSPLFQVCLCLVSPKLSFHDIGHNYILLLTCFPSPKPATTIFSFS